MMRMIWFFVMFRVCNLSPSVITRKKAARAWERRPERTGRRTREPAEDEPSRRARRRRAQHAEASALPELASNHEILRQRVGRCACTGVELERRIPYNTIFWMMHCFADARNTRSRT